MWKWVGRLAGVAVIAYAIGQGAFYVRDTRNLGQRVSQIEAFLVQNVQRAQAAAAPTAPAAAPAPKKTN